MRAHSLLVVAFLALPGLYLPASAVRSAIDETPLWKAPAAVSECDLFNGPWGAAFAPDPRAIYSFVANKQTGANPGVVVRDPQGRIWHVKQAKRHGLGAEGPVEVVLSRVLSAIGYHQPPVYYLPSFVMAGQSGQQIEPGGRFRLDDGSMQDRGPWPWRDSPFVGTRAHNGLLVVLLLFNSWDLKDSNNTLYDVRQGNRTEPWYVVRDLGGALGDSGRFWVQRNNIEKFERSSSYIVGVSHGFVEFSYQGKRPELIRTRLTVEDVRWATALLAQLTDRQWHDAFRAGGYPDEVSDRYINKIQARIAEGQQIAGGSIRSAQGRR